MCNSGPLTASPHSLLEVALGVYGTDDLLDRVREQLGERRERADGRSVRCRVVIRGACAAHHGLPEGGPKSTDGRDSQIWATSWTTKCGLKRFSCVYFFAVRAPQLRQGLDLMGDLLRQIASASTNAPRRSGNR